jgi:WD40 repeat protein
MLLTRGTDHTLKIWDVRRLASPVATHDGLYNHYSTGGCMFSPDGSMCVGCRMRGFRGEGSLHADTSSGT